MGLWSWLKATEDVALVEHSTLEELIISTELQQLSISNRLALGVAAIYRSRQMNADTLSSLPVKVGESLVPAPNATQDSQAFVSETILSLQDSGDAYWHLTSSGIRVLSHERMHVTWSDHARVINRRRVYKFENQVMRDQGISANLKVLSMNRTANDLTGTGPMESGRVKSAIALQKYADEYYLNNGQPTGILSTPDKGTADEAKLLKEAWVRERQVRQPAVLFGNMSWENTSFSPNDSQWVEASQLSTNDIATLFGVPSSLLNSSQSGAGSSITYQNVESVYQGYWRQTLKPTYTSRIERAWTEILGAQVKFDPQELFLASIQDRATAATQLAGVGYDGPEVADAVGLPSLKFERKEANVPPTR